MSLQRLSWRREEQVGQKTEWCSPVVRGHSVVAGRLGVGSVTASGERDRISIAQRSLQFFQLQLQAEMHRIMYGLISKQITKENYDGSQR